MVIVRLLAGCSSTLGLSHRCCLSQASCFKLWPGIAGEGEKEAGQDGEQESRVDGGGLGLARDVTFFTSTELPR